MKQNRSGWKGESRRHSLARKGVKTVLPDGRRFTVNNFVAKGELDLKDFDPVKMVGDGKLPNAYWVTVSNYYYIYHPIELTLVGVDDIEKDLLDDEDKDFKLWGETVKVFSTYKEALKFADEMNMQYENVMIEDRLSGVVFESYKFKSKEWKEFYEYREDIDFTKKVMKEKGVEFE